VPRRDLAINVGPETRLQQIEVTRNVGVEVLHAHVSEIHPRLGNLFALHDPSTIPRVGHDQLQPEFDIRTAFGIQILIGHAVAQHQEFRLNTSPDALRRLPYEFLYSRPDGWHLH
jgi:hypothetical protein